MSKLKTAKAIRSVFTVAGEILKWVVLIAVIAGVVVGLWAWANAHFLSFAIVIGIVVVLLIVGCLIGLWEWSTETIKEAEKDERKAQERNRVEKMREENPGVYIPTFDEEDDPHGYGAYHNSKPRKF